MSHDLIQPTLFTIWNSGGCVAVLSHMNFYYMFLLLLVVLSAYSESPQQGEPPDPLDLTVVAVCPNSSSDSLGVLALSCLRMRCLALFCFRTGIPME